MLFLLKLVLVLVLGSVLWVVAYRFINPPLTVTMAGDLIAGRGAEREWMGLDRIDRDMVRAAIAAEDGKFCSHSGFDIEAIEDAMKRNASGGRIRGGSTISQQTAKNAFLWQGGGYPRKAAEAWFTLLIEQIWGKRRIMEVYLNIAEMGPGIYGAEAAAQHYYRVAAADLKPRQAARLIAILPQPIKRDPAKLDRRNKRHARAIEKRIRVVRDGAIDTCLIARS